MTDQTETLNLRERLAHIDHLLADHQRIYADIRRDHDRKRQEIRYAPWMLVLGGLAAGAALFAAGAAFMKLFG